MTIKNIQLLKYFKYVCLKSIYQNISQQTLNSECQARALNSIEETDMQSTSNAAWPSL